MIPVLIVGHGDFGDGLRSAIEMILGGPQEAVASLALRAEEDPADFARRTDAALAELGAGETGPGIVLADLFGASPANAATSLLRHRPDLQVVTGANLPMALELLMARGSTEPAELVVMSVERGRDAIRDAGAMVRAKLARHAAEGRMGEGQ